MQLDLAYAELKLVQDFISAGNSNRPGTKLVPRFITIHNTDNAGPGANAAAHARYQKGQDARHRRVSWHFTVDDRSVYQSLPTNEVGWHAGSAQGNASSIGIEICMHEGMDEKAAYRKAALLVAVMARRLAIDVPQGVVQHSHWSGKNCPRVLRGAPGRWESFLQTAGSFARELQDVDAPDIEAFDDHDHEHGPGHATELAAGSGGEPWITNARSGLRLRAGPGTEFEILSSLVLGTAVTVVGRHGDWAKVDLGGDGTWDGFVHSSFLKRA